MADEKNLFDIEIICPDRVFHTGRAYMVEFNTTEGEIGVYKNHVPITTVLSPGVVTITDGNDQKTVAAVHRAEAAKQRAEKRLSEHAEDLDVLRAEVALKKALVRLDIKK